LPITAKTSWRPPGWLTNRRSRLCR
jgi:hypothetical protein